MILRRGKRPLPLDSRGCGGWTRIAAGWISGGEGKPVRSGKILNSGRNRVRGSAIAGGERVTLGAGEGGEAHWVLITESLRWGREGEESRKTCR